MLNTFMSKANYLAASGRKSLLINREKSDQPEHLCIFFFKAFLFAKKPVNRMNLQLYNAKSLHMALCPLPRETICIIACLH